MFQFPMTFTASLAATRGSAAHWTACSEGFELRCAVPVQFHGPGGGLSPEDLFAQALLNCFTATFLVMAEKSSLSFERLNVEGSLTVDRDDSRRPVMKEFKFHIHLAACDATERATVLVRKAMESGFILNSVRTALTYELHFEA